MIGNAELKQIREAGMGRKRTDEVPETPEEAAKTKKYSIVIDTDLVRKIRVLAAADDVSPPDWVNNHLRRIIKEHWRNTIDELDSE